MIKKDCLYYEETNDMGATVNWCKADREIIATCSWCDEYVHIDLVPVVRCKDCKHRDPEDHKCDSGALERVGCIFSVADDYFCAWGERRDAND